MQRKTKKQKKGLLLHYLGEKYFEICETNMMETDDYALKIRPMTISYHKATPTMKTVSSEIQDKKMKKTHRSERESTTTKMP